MGRNNDNTRGAIRLERFSGLDNRAPGAGNVVLLDRERRRAFTRSELDAWEFDVLAALRRAGTPYQLSPQELLQQTLVSSGNMTNRIDRLVERGHVVRQVDPNDGRGVLVEMTEAGLTRVDAATDKADCWMRMRALSALTQTPGRAPVRAERARIVVLASSNERFGQALSVEQDRLTKAMADTISRAQDKGWVSTALSARAISVFLQAYSLGRAVDDIASDHIANDDWVTLIEAIIRSLEAD